MTFQYVASDGLATSAPATVTITIVQPIRTPEQILAQLEFHIDDFIGVGELDTDAGAALLAETGEIADALAAGDQQAALNQTVEVAGMKIDELVKDEALSLAAANQLYRFAHDLLRSLGAFMPASLLDLRVAINEFVALGELAPQLAKKLRNDAAKILRHVASGEFDKAFDKIDQFLKTLTEGLGHGKIASSAHGSLVEGLNSVRSNLELGGPDEHVPSTTPDDPVALISFDHVQKKGLSKFDTDLSFDAFEAEFDMFDAEFSKQGFMKKKPSSLLLLMAADKATGTVSRKVEWASETDRPEGKASVRLVPDGPNPPTHDVNATGRIRQSLSWSLFRGGAVGFDGSTDIEITTVARFSFFTDTGSFGTAELRVMLFVQHMLFDDGEVQVVTAGEAILTEAGPQGLSVTITDLFDASAKLKDTLKFTVRLSEVGTFQKIAQSTVTNAVPFDRLTIGEAGTGDSQFEGRADFRTRFLVKRHEVFDVQERKRATLEDP